MRSTFSAATIFVCVLSVALASSCIFGDLAGDTKDQRDGHDKADETTATDPLAAAAITTVSGHLAIDTNTAGGETVNAEALLTNEQGELASFPAGSSTITAGGTFDIEIPVGQTVVVGPAEGTALRLQAGPGWQVIIPPIEVNQPAAVLVDDIANTAAALLKAGITGDRVLVPALQAPYFDHAGLLAAAELVWLAEAEFAGNADPAFRAAALAELSQTQAEIAAEWAESGVLPASIRDAITETNKKITDPALVTAVAETGTAQELKMGAPFRSLLTVVNATRRDNLIQAGFDPEAAAGNWNMADRLVDRLGNNPEKITKLAAIVKARAMLKVDETMDELEGRVPQEELDLMWAQMQAKVKTASDPQKLVNPLAPASPIYSDIMTVEAASVDATTAAIGISGKDLIVTFINDPGLQQIIQKASRADLDLIDVRPDVVAKVRELFAAHPQVKELPDEEILFLRQRIVRMAMDLVREADVKEAQFDPNTVLVKETAMTTIDDRVKDFQVNATEDQLVTFISMKDKEQAVAVVDGETDRTQELVRFRDKCMADGGVATTSYYNAEGEFARFLCLWTDEISPMPDGRCPVGTSQTDRFTCKRDGRPTCLGLKEGYERDRQGVIEYLQDKFNHAEACTRIVITSEGVEEQDCPGELAAVLDLKFDGGHFELSGLEKEFCRFVPKVNTTLTVTRPPADTTTTTDETNTANSNDDDAADDRVCGEDGFTGPFGCAGEERCRPEFGLKEGAQKFCVRDPESPVIPCGVIKNSSLAILLEHIKPDDEFRNVCIRKAISYTDSEELAKCPDMPFAAPNNNPTEARPYVGRLYHLREREHPESHLCSYLLGEVDESEWRRQSSAGN